MGQDKNNLRTTRLFPNLSTLSRLIQKNKIKKGETRKALAAASTNLALPTKPISPSLILSMYQTNR